MEGLHVLPFGHDVIVVWRLLFWIGAVFVCGYLISDALGRGGLTSTRLGRLALIIMISRFCLVQALRWNQPAFWEGLPLETVALVLAGLSVWYYRRPVEDEARDSSGVPRRYR